MDTDKKPDILHDDTDRHTDDELTQAMNRAVQNVGEEIDPFTILATRRTLERTEW